ncbi:MAG: acyl carrier protein [Deltaproteobacteria bacterium]|nr:acyl carrier protein [Candidatus Anaeroferrophillacea bacterium]
MTDTVDVTGRIRQELAVWLRRDVVEVQPEHALRDDLGLDSMAIIELLYSIEDAFGLQISDEDLAGLMTVGDVAAYVEGRLAS